MGKTILVVDDEPGYRELIRFHFSSQNVQVLTASNGREALDVVRAQGSVDLVITDLRMPQMDGLDTVVSVRRMLPETPAILVTAHEADERAAELLRLSLTRGLRKPFDLHDLSRLVDSVLPPA